MNDLARKAQFPLLFACAAAPAAALISAAFCPGLLRYVLLVPALYTLSAILCLLVPGRWRLAAGILGCALLLACGTLMPGATKHPLALLIPTGFSVMLLAGLRMGAWPKDTEPPAALFIAGALAHVLLQFVTHIARKNGTMPELQAVSPQLLACFWLFLLLSMLSMGRAALLGANWGKQRAPFAMRVKNTSLCIGLWALILLLSCSHAIVESMRRMWNMVRAGVVAALRALMHLIPESDAPVMDGVGGGVPGFYPPAVQNEPGALAVLLERIVSVLAFAAMILLAAYALHVLFQKLRALVRSLLGRLVRFAANSSEDYIDEISDTRESAEVRAVLLPRVRLRLVPRSGLSPRERIRTRYAQMRSRHPAWTSANTARETLPAGASSLYERARYSKHDITAEDAQRFERESRQAKP